MSPVGIRVGNDQWLVHKKRFCVKEMLNSGGHVLRLTLIDVPIFFGLKTSR